MEIVHMAGILLFALAVALGGLFMLAYSKKENLGKIYSITALVAVIFACSVFVFGVAGGILCAACGKCHKGGKGGKMEKRMMMMHQMHGMGGHEMMWTGMGDCDGGSCPMMSGCSHHGMGSGDCSTMKCKKGDKCSMHDGMKKEVKVEVQTDDGKKVEKTVEIK